MKKIIWILLILAAVSVPIGAILLAQNYFPDECQNCPYCGNLGRQVKIFYDPSTNQYLGNIPVTRTMSGIVRLILPPLSRWFSSENLLSQGK